MTERPDSLNINSSSTLADVVTDETGAWRAWARRSILIVAALGIVFALCGGTQREATAQVGFSRGEVHVTYPATVRAGSDIRHEVTVGSEEGPLPETLAFTVPATYLELFEDLDISPEPAKEKASEDGSLVLEVEVPKGSRQFTLSVTGRAADQWQPYVSAEISTSFPSGERTSSAVGTWRFP